jgi:hypothetical protein
MLLAAALQTFFAFKATAVFWVLDELSGARYFTDTLATIFIQLHVWPTESWFLETRAV